MPYAREIRKQESRGFIFRTIGGRTAAEGPNEGSATGRMSEKFPKEMRAHFWGNWLWNIDFSHNFPNTVKWSFSQAMRKTYFESFLWYIFAYIQVLMTITHLQKGNSPKLILPFQSFPCTIHSHSDLISYYCTRLGLFSTVFIGHRAQETK